MNGQQQQRTKCRKCRGTGLVPVPRVTVKDGGEIVAHYWPKLTKDANGQEIWQIPEVNPTPQMTLVVCTCGNGNRHLETRLKGLHGYENPRMDLKFYEMRLNPNWERQLEDLARAKRDLWWAQNKHKSPWKDLTVTDEHTREGEGEIAMTYATSQGIPGTKLFAAAQYHPAYLYLDGLSMAMVRDIVEFFRAKRGLKARGAA